MRKWKAPKHGDESKYIHVRLRSPSGFDTMRTASIGDGLKQVYGKSKSKNEWRPQNIMIPRDKVSVSEGFLKVKTNKLKKRLEQQGINERSIIKMKSGGSADYRHPSPPCPGSRIRSRGHGRVSGIGRRHGPRNKRNIK
jgi:hypothetical protein